MNGRWHFSLNPTVALITALLAGALDLAAEQVDFIVYEDERAEQPAVETQKGIGTLSYDEQLQRLIDGDLIVSPAVAEAERDAADAPVALGDVVGYLSPDDPAFWPWFYQTAGDTFEVNEENLPVIGLGERFVRDVGKVWLEYFELDESLREVLQEMKRRQKAGLDHVAPSASPGGGVIEGVPIMAESEIDIFADDRPFRENGEEFPLLGIVVVVLFFFVMIIGAIVKSA